MLIVNYFRIPILQFRIAGVFLFSGVDFAVALQLAVAHAFHKLTCIGAKAFHVAALSLGVEGVERPRRLAGARNASNRRYRATPSQVLQRYLYMRTNLDMF